MLHAAGLGIAFCAKPKARWRPAESSEVQQRFECLSGAGGLTLQNKPDGFEHGAFPHWYF